MSGQPGGTDTGGTDPGSNTGIHTGIDSGTAAGPDTAPRPDAASGQGMRPESWLVVAARPTNAGEPLNVPPIPAANFNGPGSRNGAGARGGIGEGAGCSGAGGNAGAARTYARQDGTPTWEALETIVGGLEGGQAVAFASGMAAIAAVFDQLTTGAVIALPDDGYQGVVGLAAAGVARRGWSVQRVAVADTAGWIEACRSADLIWLESASNPLLAVADLEAIGAAPRKPGAILAVDNTFATPLNQRPLAFGATVSVQSATKFIGGHSDLLAGVVTARQADLWQALRSSRALTGATPGALEAFLAVRGARTLALRLERAQQNALLLGQRLEAHPLVARVYYPGLASHPTHAVAQRVLRGFGTLLAFELRGAAAQADEPWPEPAVAAAAGAEAAVSEVAVPEAAVPEVPVAEVACAEAAFADAVCRSLRLIRHATSLGAVESTIERRAALPGQEHLPPSLLRLSVGIEAVEDLWDDLDTALRAARP